MRLMLDGENDDDVGGDDDVGSSFDGGSVDGGDAPHGWRFFRCHCRGDGSFSGVAIMMLLLSSLLLRRRRCRCRCHVRRLHGRRQCPRSVVGGVIHQGR